MVQLATSPYWLDSLKRPVFPALDRNLHVDVVVIGAGITGVTAAYLMKSAGLTVALVERDRAGGMDTGHTTAHLTYVTDLRLSDLVRSFGQAHAQAVWDAGRTALDQIETTIRMEGIDCEFRPVAGYLHEPAAGVADTDTRVDFNAEAELARRLGFDATYVDRVPFFAGEGVKYESQAAFHPGQYLSALLRIVAGEGSHVFEHTNVDEITDEPTAVKAGAHTIQCDYVVIATHVPLMGKTNLASAAFLQTKLAPYSSYAVGAKVPSGTLPLALFWDTADPYHYLRVDEHPGFDYVILGGEDHKTGQASTTAACYDALDERLRAIAPGAVFTHKWSGQVIETNDGLPYIGETASRQFAATGFSGNGMTFGTLGGMMARDAALGRSNPWARLFDIHRTHFAGGTWDYIKENKDYLYYLARDRFAAAEGSSLRALRPGHGKLLDIKGERVAASRDARGVVSLLSPYCTHLGCLVAWNDAERTWDCPCHGSRFKPDGEVLAGPAESPLTEPPAPRASQATT